MAFKGQIVVLATIVICCLLDSSDAFSFSSSSNARFQQIVTASSQGNQISARGQLFMRKGRRSSKDKPAAKQVMNTSSGGAWLKLMNSGKEIPEGEGKSKAISTTDTFGKEQTFLAVRYQKEYYTMAVNCGRCKFPLLNGEVVAGEEGKDPSLQCPLCGVGFSIKNGQPTGLNKPPGMIGGFMSNLMSKSETNAVKVFPTQANDVGEIYCKFDYI
mmetsp:Transcript_28119/g.45752  ORF Transcript_28119/g.45752 Transcript_28119/m.45752 type:complete len:215 (-) Transcript_28119:312-956(-)